MMILPIESVEEVTSDPLYAAVMKDAAGWGPQPVAAIEDPNGDLWWLEANVDYRRIGKWLIFYWHVEPEHRGQNNVPPDNHELMAWENLQASSPELADRVSDGDEEYVVIIRSPRPESQKEWTKFFQELLLDNQSPHYYEVDGMLIIVWRH